jgi:hypothetical protein
MFEQSVDIALCSAVIVMKWYYTAGALLFGIVGTILTAISVIPNIPDAKDSTYLGWISIHSGLLNTWLLIFLCGIIVFCILNGIRIIFSTASRRFVQRLSRETKYTTRDCIESDLQWIVSVATEEYGEYSTDYGQTKRLFDIDPSIFKIIVDYDNSYVGYFCIIRLTKDCIQSLNDGTFSLKNIPELFIRRDVRYKDNFIYIGSVYGADSSTHKNVIAQLAGYLLAIEPRIIYARATTPAGLKILVARNFKTVDSAHPELGKIFFYRPK